jgi:hypothetical protein
MEVKDVRQKLVGCCYATASELIAKAMDLMEEFVSEVRASKA